MKTLHNFNVNALQDEEMEWVVGGGDPETESDPWDDRCRYCGHHVDLCRCSDTE